MMGGSPAEDHAAVCSRATSSRHGLTGAGRAHTAAHVARCSIATTIASTVFSAGSAFTSRLRRASRHVAGRVGRSGRLQTLRAAHRHIRG